MGQKIRNVILLGHTGSGKSSLTKSLLQAMGKDVNRAELKKNTRSTFFSCEHQDDALVLIDTPGNDNFCHDSMIAAHIADSAILSICADEAHSFQTEKAAQLIQLSTMPAIIFINKMDVAEADFSATVAAIKKNIILDPALIFLPIGSGPDFQGVIDVINERAIYFSENGAVRHDTIPPELASEAYLALQKLMEQVAETDDELIEEFLEEGELDIVDLKYSLARAVASCALAPVLPGAAKGSLGIGTLIEMINNLFPPAPSADSPLLAQLFRHENSSEHGPLLYCKVKQGTLNKDTFNISRKCPEQIKKIFIPDGDDLAETDSLTAGMIGALSGLRYSGPGDTIASLEDMDPLAELPSPPHPSTTCSVHSAETDMEAMFTALAMAIAEDPSLQVAQQPQTGETLLSGQGRLHLETVCQQIRDRHGIELHLTLPQIPYQEANSSPDNNNKMLEPIMKLTIDLPVDSVGQVIRDLNNRRAKVMEMKSRPGNETIISQVPMAEILEYGADLAQLSDGRATFTTDFSHYEQLPPHLASHISAGPS
ncbi:MAG: GTP-binding protein [Thermodesulfobacteriota bacterium]